MDKQFAELKSDVNKQFEQVNTQFKHVNNKVDRLQWFIVASALAVIFKEQIFALFHLTQRYGNGSSPCHDKPLKS
ncbi:hypothetical protein JCM19233_1851 [Vibrio astriarenae]|nr:hypothetical protein JCM19233_1851 [Vibrio sp. C7]